MSNAIGAVKIVTLLFVIVTGFVILGGNTKIENPTANFKNSFHGTETATAYGLTNALYRIIFSYGGYNNAFNVVNEVKVCLPSRLGLFQPVSTVANLSVALESCQVPPEVRLPSPLHSLHPLYSCQRGILFRR